MNHPIFTLGLDADTALTMIKLSGRNHVRSPKKIGKDKYGYIVKWFVKDATLTFKRKKKKDCYRIVKVDSPIQ